MRIEITEEWQKIPYSSGTVYNDAIVPVELSEDKAGGVIIYPKKRFGFSTPLYIRSCNGTVYVNIVEFSEARGSGASGDIDEDLKKRIRNIEIKAEDDVEDIFDIPEDKIQNIFTLKKKPYGALNMFVDGFYYDSTNYTYDKDTNAVTWTNDAANGGFDITDAKVVFRYDPVPAT